MSTTPSSSPLNKICVLVIDGTSKISKSDPNYYRSLKQKELWTHFANTYQHLDVFFLKCSESHFDAPQKSAREHKIDALFKTTPSDQIGYTKTSDEEYDTSIKVFENDLPPLALAPTDPKSWRNHIPFMVETSFKPHNLHIDMENHTITCDTTESLIPGIFQKTILALQHLIDRYDIFVRSNLSTIFFEDQLLAHCQKYLHTPNVPVYEGSHIDQFYNGYQYKWVMGHSVFLNRKAATYLVFDGLDSHFFDDPNTPDDVLMAYILVSYDIHPTHTGTEMYQWNNQMSFQHNMDIIRKNNIPYMRTKFMRDDEYARLVDFLVNSRPRSPTHC